MFELPVWARLVLAVFATFRLARLLARDEGPAGVFEKLRTALGAYDYGPEQDDAGQPMARTSLGRLMVCPHCLGVYAAVLCAGLFLWAHPLAALVLLALGIAGAQSWLQSLGDRA